MITKSIFTDCNKEIYEEIPPHPVLPYGADKLAGEVYCSAYNSTYDIDTVVLRFGSVYGRGSLHNQSVVARLNKQALANKNLEIFGDGFQAPDFIYFDDLVRAFLLAVYKPMSVVKHFKLDPAMKPLYPKLLKPFSLFLKERVWRIPKLSTPQFGKVTFSEITPTL